MQQPDDGRKSLGDLIKLVAAQKVQAGQARFKPADPDAEPPREVFMRACERVAGEFVPLGFKFAKSGPHVRRVRAKVEEQVWFQSSQLNVAGRSVGFETGVIVRDPALARWQRENQSPFAGSDGTVAAGNLGNLRDGQYTTWDIADPATRDATLATVIAMVRDVALPFFDLVAEPERLLDLVVAQQRPHVCVDEGTVIDLLMRHRGPGDAAAYVRSRLTGFGDPKEYEKELARARAGRRPDYRPSGYAMVYALAVGTYDLTVD